jgi:hypothetical protein
MLVRVYQFDEFNLFGSVVVVGFQSIFYLEMHQNDVFLFLKIIFDISALK